MTGDASEQEQRRTLMALVARASPGALTAALARLPVIPPHDDVRSPEIGLVMVRGRTGGVGAPFNLGEASATRAVVRLESGETGFSCVLGRDLVKARAAALLDALWQRADMRESLNAHVLGPLRTALDQEDSGAALRTAATRVEFFTLVRGEDAA